MRHLFSRMASVMFGKVYADLAQMEDILPRMMPILIIVTGTPRRTPGCTGPGSQVPGIFGVAMVTVFLTPRTCSRLAGAPG